MSRSALGTAALLIAGALGLAGCGGGGGSGGESAARDTSTIKAADSSLGRILVDGNGRTLYLFTGDSQNTNAMDCDAACLRLWPPMEGTPKAGAGVDASRIGSTAAKGDKTQATYAGHPLYYYADDKSAGDVNGQGIDKIWYVLDAAGSAITKSPKPADNGGYGY
ncbi:hypothetical protein HRW07_17020 [Streptomyces lunaelactis]|uniref:COG4315 family predicted lipoprotein n=1 Tax=Streptomyces lunaelactis TaxID=1535768 RepID=UPI0015846EEA|nr:hypothetical protein [Streptomyces lunaelactis]NUL04898.1 hypothetical protein [Streptomyces lunaelactis]